MIAVNTQLINHVGTIKSINNQHLIVKIVSQSACSSCHAKGACTSAEQKEKEIEVEYRGEIYGIGEEVLVVATLAQGYKALLFAYLLPLILLVCSLILISSISKEESTAALGSLLLLVPYYWLLYHYRHKLKNSFHFMVQKQQNISQYE
jgi:sigma-E factor negative regulatory protein RseC